MMTTLARRACTALTALLGTISVLAQTTTLQTFTSDTNTANLVQAADGTIYGVTRPSSANATTNGTVFKLQPDGSGFQVVHAFAGGAAGARLPDYAFIFGRDGALYGTGEFGGTANGGMLYKVNPDGSGFALLRSFTGHDQPTVVRDAGTPKGGLVHASDGFLYGAATKGTATSTNFEDRSGVIYRIAPDGSGYRLIFSFDGSPNYPNGLGPTTLIEGRDGRLYGTTIGGGVNGIANGRGTVFVLRTDGTGFTVLRSFNSSAASLEPKSPLVHATDGYLYGTTSGGSIFRLLPDGSGFETIYTFSTSTPTRADTPAGAFFQGRDGSFYGRTDAGGANNFGAIYKVRTDGTGFRILASFSTSRSGYFGGLIQGLDGALYATTERTIIRVVEAPGLEITQQPRSQTIAPGGSVTFTVTAPGATTYQWRRNGMNIAGATTASYTLNNLTAAANNATYSVVAANAIDSVTSDGAVLLVAAPIPGRLINLSVRTGAGTGAQTLIAGFVVGGTGSKQVLVRAIGPTLGVFGVTGVLADPQLALFNSTSTPIASNNGWGGGASLTNAFTQVGAFALGATSRDAALLSPLPAGGYSAQVVSSGGTGVALVEAYDADGASSATRFINLSARTLAGTGAQTLIAGFVLSGNVPKSFLIRGVGPGLNQFGVTGTLANPRLELHTTVNNQDTIVASNFGWAGAPALSAAFTQVGAFAFPATSADAALLLTLTPGSYTAQINGAGNTTGVALVEIYEVP